MSPSSDNSTSRPTKSHAFRTFFLRGLGIVLPTLLTIYLIMFAYSILQNNVAAPINSGVREAMILVSKWPQASNDDFLVIMASLPPTMTHQLDQMEEELRANQVPLSERQMARIQWLRGEPDAAWMARRHAVEQWWNSYRIGTWHYLNLIGLVLAILLIYTVGLLLGRSAGYYLYLKGESLIQRLPVIRGIYSSVKQVTDFFFSDDQKLQFSKVVAVQYPRKGLWSVGLVTGETMQLIEKEAGRRCLTVFVPSSPTPFTGYVITVPREDSIDLPITIEEAIKFAVSGGVLIPPNQVIHREIAGETLQYPSVQASVDLPAKSSDPD